MSRLGRNFRRGGNPQLSILQRALRVLRKYGTDAHAYIPGVGVLNGLTAGNYTDTAGTQLTTKDQFVGLDLDAMGTTSFLSVPQDLTTWTSGGAFGSWSGTTATASTITATAALAARRVRYPITPGTQVNVSATVIAGTTTGSVWVVFGTSVPAYISAATSASVASGYVSTGLVAPSNAAYVEITVRATDSGGTVGFTGISVSTKTGIHATQGTAGNKPVLRQGSVNMLLNSATLSTQSVAVAASPYTLSFTGTGTVTKSGTATGALVGTGATDRVTQTFTPTAGTLTLTVTGSVTSAQLQLGSTATTYIPTTSAKASAGTGPSYWEFGGDGTPTDYLGLGSVPFQMSNDFVVVVASRLSYAPGGSNAPYVFANKANSFVSVGSITYSEAGNPNAHFYDGTTTASITHAASVLTPAVISCRKVGNEKILRVNGAQSGAANTAEMSNVVPTNSYIGASGGSVAATLSALLYFPGDVYCTFAIKGTVSDADLLLIERLAASLAGVTLA